MEYFKIGKIVGTHGVSGKLVVQHSLGKRNDFEKTEAIFIDNGNETFMPWFITSASAKTNDETFIEVEGIATKEAARVLLKKEVWLEEDDFKRLAAGTAAISLLGYSVIDQGQNLGEILEVIEQPHQTLCKIMLEAHEAWIPVHEATLIKVDRKQRQVFVQLPDGLLDVYRN